jgi:hypothetical protein
MTFSQRKLLVLSAWVATVVTVGLILTVDRPNLWVLVGAVAMVPAAVANWFWDRPDPTLAELIARGRSRP